MERLEAFFNSLEGWTGYVFLFFSSLGENLFPPMPGDTFVVLGAFLVGRGHMRFFPAYLAASAGSVLGFMLLYLVGRRWGQRIFQGRSGRLFSEKNLVKIDVWFDRYGILVIAANRFLSGFRSVISLAAGMAKMDAKVVLGLCLVSTLIWNGIIMAAGLWVGEHWTVIMGHYQRVVFSLVMLAILFFIIRSVIRRRKRISL
jgi:membrane protein DedA with SNARE-associated domain